MKATYFLRIKMCQPCTKKFSLLAAHSLIVQDNYYAVYNINPLPPNIYMSYRTANLQTLHLNIYSTNIRTEYFKRAFSLQSIRLFHNATLFGSCIIHILNTGCAEILKKIRPQRVNSGDN
jgi:hypothetical protein